MEYADDVLGMMRQGVDFSAFQAQGQVIYPDIPNSLKVMPGNYLSFLHPGGIDRDGFRIKRDDS